MNCLGISRELTNSPNREDDDAAILAAVIGELSGHRVRTQLLSPEAADRSDLAGWDMIVPMCESYPRLMRLKALPSSTVLVNPPDAVLDCYRIRMIERFADAGVRLPETEIRTTAAATSVPPPAFAGDGVWIKRGDVHNTCDHDVVFARDWKDVEAARRDFESREISHLILQRHVDGDLLKFYGVGPGRWFTWFYHDPETARRLPFEITELAEAAAAAARAVGLEIFGGDAIVAPDGTLYVIDINSWPSFARVRAEAAKQIAWLLESKLKALAGRRGAR